MLFNLERLSVTGDGRFASDQELKFLQGYSRSFSQRKAVYLKLQAAEKKILEQVYAKMRSLNPKLFMNGNLDMSEKWKRDTLLVIRHSAMAMLLDDPEYLKQEFLLWFQTLMQAFGTEENCRITYSVMQDVVKHMFNEPEAQLINPILALNEEILGTSKVAG
ncbi:MAG: phycobilisome protein [Pseudanabaenaceae cyanobacterium bins.68]|nr:phycobilisome protein [Pseudanabaenaceae cyanobacterium bins.68]